MAKPIGPTCNLNCSNCFLLDDARGAFLKRSAFLVGLSIDGPQELHNKHRKDKSGGGTFQKVLDAAKLLKKHGIPLNTFTTVNYDNVKKPVEVYRFLRTPVGEPGLDCPCSGLKKYFRHIEPRSKEMVEQLKAGEALVGS